MVLVLAIHPGQPSIQQGGAPGEEAEHHHSVSPLDTFLDVVRNMFPENVIQATFQRAQTNYVLQKPKSSRGKLLPTTVRKEVRYAEGVNILGGC